MKRNNIYLGAIGVVVAAAGYFGVSNWMNSNGEYTQNKLSAIQEQNANDAQRWLEARLIDVTTGERVTPEVMQSIMKQVQDMPRLKSATFKDLGPDNIGGRTRAICIERGNNNRIWAGGVSGGLWVTSNGGNQWAKVDTYPGSPFISSITMTIDKTLFVATGSANEQWNGDGLWMSNDLGATWTQVTGTSSLPVVNEVVTDNVNNVVWISGSGGIRKYDNNSGTLTNASVGSGNGTALDISPNGQVIVAATGSNKTYVSVDGGNTWTDKSGSASNVVPIGGGRIEYAVSKTLNSSGNYSIYAVRTSANLNSMHVSHDSGQNWSQFVGSSGTPSNLDIYRNQGTYNSIVTVRPNNPERIIIGGIDLWKWDQTVNNPPSGGFEKISQWFAPPFSPVYVHADNHELKWDSNNVLYIGNDGGIGKSFNTTEFFPANRGYNVTQFYGIAFDGYGRVMGGAQDNGTLYNDFEGSTFQEFAQVNGGDGFDCAISFFNPDVMFSTVYYNSLSRSGNRGEGFTSFVPTLPGIDPAGTEGNYHPFHSHVFFFENYDLNSEDSVSYRVTMDVTAGTTLQIPSAATGNLIDYVTTTNLYFDDTLQYNPGLTVDDPFVVLTGTNTTAYNLNNYTWSGPSFPNPPNPGDAITINLPTGPISGTVATVTLTPHYYGQNTITSEIFDMGTQQEVYNVAWDTIVVPDPYQSWFFMYVNANGGEIWGTRDAARLSDLTPTWVPVARGIGGGLFNEVDLEMSADLEYLYISAQAGVWRIDGLGSIYTSDPDFNTKAGYLGTGISNPPTATTALKITTINCEGIGLNPNDPDDLLLLQGSAGTVRRSANATSATPSFTPLGNISSPNPAVYDGVISATNDNVLVIGTSVGAFVSEDNGATWLNASAGFDGTPVYTVIQNSKPFSATNTRYGEIYLGTFGRGIWSSESYLSVNENAGAGVAAAAAKIGLKAYPNPTLADSRIVFELNSTSDVRVNVFDISGKLVQTISKKNLEAGEHELDINSASFPRGTYIVKVVAGSISETTKFVKM